MTFSRGRLDSYFERLAAVLRHVNVGYDFPDTDTLASYIDALRDLNGLNRLPFNVQISTVSGMPTAAAWCIIGAAQKAASLRLSTQKKNDFAVDERELLGDGGEFHYQRMQAFRAADRMVLEQASGLNEFRVDVIDFDEKAQKKTFRISYDQLTAQGLLLRTSIKVHHSTETSWFDWNPILSKKGNEWKLRQDVCTKIAVAGEQPLSALAMVLTAELKDACIEIRRGTLGPLWFNEAQKPAEVRSIFSHHPQALVCSAKLETFKRGEMPKDVPTDEGAGMTTLRGFGWQPGMQKTYFCTPDICGDLITFFSNKDANVTIKQIDT